MTKMKIIDFEHHYFAKPYYEYLLKNKSKLIKNPEYAAIYLSFSMPSNNIKGVNFGNEISCQDNLDLKIMDLAKLQCGVLSISDGIESLPKKDSITLAKQSNDYTAYKIKQNPDRFLGTFCLPTLCVNEALKEIDRAVKLGLKYFHTHSSYGKKRLSDKEFEPIIKKCAQLNIPIYIHPCYQSDNYFLDMPGTLAAACFGFGVDVMKTFLCLVTNGVFDRYPNLKIILGHMGEFYPYTQTRIDNIIGVFKNVDKQLKCKHSLQYYLEHDNIYVTTSGIFDPEVALFAIKKLGIDHILFGADFSYENCKRSVDFVLNLPISKKDKEKICYLNGEKLLNIKGRK